MCFNLKLLTMLRNQCLKAMIHVQALGKNNIICIEDLVHEIYTVGPAFKQASNFLWPFKLSAARVSTHVAACELQVEPVVALSHAPRLGTRDVHNSMQFQLFSPYLRPWVLCEAVGGW